MARCFIKSSGIVERKVRGEHLLVPIARSETALDSFFVLNETAQFIWTRAIAGRPEEDIAAALATEFKTTPAEAADDTRRVLDELLSIGALKVKEDI
jgi:hypothetical protein